MLGYFIVITSYVTAYLRLENICMGTLQMEKNGERGSHFGWPQSLDYHHKKPHMTDVKTRLGVR